MDAAQWRDRFETFAAKKTAAAVTTALPPYVTDSEQPRDGMLAIGNPWTRELFGGAFYLSTSPETNRPSSSLVFVRSADGNTGAANPADLGGGQTDAHVVYEGLSRVAADAVLAGAETVRGGDVMFSVWHPELIGLRASFGLPRHPTQIVATRRGLDVDRMLLFNIPGVSVIVLTVSDGIASMQDALRTRPWVRAVVMHDERGLRAAFEQLSAFGVKRVSCIGGRRLAHDLIDEDLIDDTYLTTSPKFGGHPDTRLPEAASAGALVVRRRGTREETGVVFEHFASVSRARR